MTPQWPAWLLDLAWRCQATPHSDDSRTSRVAARIRAKLHARRWRGFPNDR